MGSWLSLEAGVTETERLIDLARRFYLAAHSQPDERIKNWLKEAELRAELKK